MSTTFSYSGSHVLISDSSDVALMKDKLDALTYSLKFNEKSGKFYLDIIEDFKINHELYGDIINNSERILSTFLDRGKSTGVLLLGEKGMGKSLLLKQTCIKAREMGIPTIVINSPFTGEEFNQFIQAVSVNPTLIIIDEFEKVYNLQEDGSCQGRLLTLLDGTYNSNSLFIFTSNDQYKIDRHMINRPGRIFYLFKYDTLDENVIEQFCEDKLNNKDHIKSVVSLSKIINKFNFDMLNCIISEMNRYNETVKQVLAYLNIELENNSKKYKSKIYIDGIFMEEDVLELSPFINKFTYPIEEWSRKECVSYLKDNYNINLSENGYYIEFTPNDIINFDKKTGVIIMESTGVIVGIVRLELSPFLDDHTNSTFYKYLA